MSSYQTQKNPFNKSRPFVYAVMWTELGVAYVGVRYAINCHPDDLWTRYFTSSQYVKEFREKHGEPDHIEVIETFLTAKEAIDAEHDIIMTFDLHINSGFLNKACGGRINTMDADVREKIRIARTGTKRSPETCKKISEIQKGQKRKPLSEETRAKISEANKGRPSDRKGVPRSEEDKAKIKAGMAANPQLPPMLGRKHNEETKKKMSAALKGKPKSEAHSAALKVAQQARRERERAKQQNLVLDRDQLEDLWQDADQPSCLRDKFNTYKSECLGFQDYKR